ncbi:MAG TPA: hypothetical protein PLO67_08705 [Saprospiraceae bacterium]|nr:hypothetical protein [Saprospiraceae bacterium]HPI08093.1 hypothetical protein [Saprospiraceae bacterium]
MNILTEEYQFNSKEEFRLLFEAIQTEMDRGNLSEFSDPTGYQRIRNDYISLNNRKMYRLKGRYSSTFQDASEYNGTWEVIRSETEKPDGRIFRSSYSIRKQEPGVFADLEFVIDFTRNERASILFEWILEPDGPVHSRLIKSSIEFGIISAFEDVSPEPGAYWITIKRARYHHIDSSFSLLCYAANRNVKRAFFVEQEDLYPKLENGLISRKFRPYFTIGKWNYY